MVLLNIVGVPVHFPYEPYACQKAYMTRLITALRSGSNALLESPTGTGKTLCLLCATLAWREHEKMQRENELGAVVRAKAESAAAVAAPDKREAIMADTEVRVAEMVAAAVGIDGNPLLGPIMFTSRTHTQLAQAVQELKKTEYRPKVCILGSREQLCIHPEVRVLPSNSAKIAMCRAKTSTRSCTFHINVEQGEKEREAELHAQGDPIMDIEDLVGFGSRYRTCPYYLTRRNIESADIVFLPYNYIINDQTRNAQQLQLTRSVIIFDEAHNIASSCEDAASFQLTPDLMATCVGEVQSLLDADHVLTPSKGDLALFKSLLLEIEEAMAAEDTGHGDSGRTLPGTYIYSLLERCRIHKSSAQAVIETMEATVTALQTERAASGTGSQRCFLEEPLKMFKFLFGDNATNRKEQIESFYRVHIAKIKPTKRGRRGGGGGGRSDGWGDVAASKEGGTEIHFWCFSSQFAMTTLSNLGVRSIVLTSGTLAPLQAMESEMQMDFKVRLENPHVIEKHQMWVGVVSKGPAGTSLNSSYRTRSSPEYMSDLGNTIVNFCRVVPKGVLVFFSSYGVMKSCIKFWQEPQGGQGRCTWDRIEQFKTPLMEPQDKPSFLGAMHLFYEKVRDPASHGAVFFAVCRGKVSEGLDFADDNGRAVIITGLPFPNVKDPRIVCKRAYMDEARRLGGSALGLSGADWYQMQASRAVNQAIGRVIRHRKDYGAVLLCDERFESAHAVAQLPGWVRGQVTIHDNFGAAQSSLSRFFKTASARPELNEKRANAAMAAIIATAGTGAAAASAAKSGFTPAGAERRLPSRVAAYRSQPKVAIRYDEPSSDVEQQVRSRPPAPKPSLLSALSGHKATNVQVDAPYRGRYIDPAPPPAVSSRPKQMATGPGDAGAANVARVRTNPFSAPELKLVAQSDNRSVIPTKARSRTNSLYGAGTSIDIATTGTPSSSKGPNHQAHTATSDAPSSSKGPNPEAREIMKEYLDELRSTTSPDVYQEFKTIMREHRKSKTASKTHTTQEAIMSHLVAELSRIFLPNHAGLLRGFRRTMKNSPRRTMFDKLVNDILATKASKREATQPLAASTIVPKRPRPNKMQNAPARPPESNPERCAECRRKLNAPFVAHCGHICCHLCWLEILKRPSNKCPTCNLPVTKKSLKKLYLYS